MTVASATSQARIRRRQSKPNVSLAPGQQSISMWVRPAAPQATAACVSPDLARSSSSDASDDICTSSTDRPVPFSEPVGTFCRHHHAKETPEFVNVDGEGSAPSRAKAADHSCSGDCFETTASVVKPFARVTPGGLRSVSDQKPAVLSPPLPDESLASSAAPPKQLSHKDASPAASNDRGLLVAHSEARGGRPKRKEPCGPAKVACSPTWSTSSLQPAVESTRRGGERRRGGDSKRGCDQRPGGDRKRAAKVTAKPPLPTPALRATGSPALPQEETRPRKANDEEPERFVSVTSDPASSHAVSAAATSCVGIADDCGDFGRGHEDNRETSSGGLQSLRERLAMRCRRQIPRDLPHAASTEVAQERSGRKRHRRKTRENDAAIATEHKPIGSLSLRWHLLFHETPIGLQRGRVSGVAPSSDQRAAACAGEAVRGDGSVAAEEFIVDPPSSPSKRARVELRPPAIPSSGPVTSKIAESLDGECRDATSKPSCRRDAAARPLEKTDINAASTREASPCPLGSRRMQGANLFAEKPAADQSPPFTPPHIRREGSTSTPTPPQTQHSGRSSPSGSSDQGEKNMLLRRRVSGVDRRGGVEETPFHEGSARVGRSTSVGDIMNARREPSLHDSATASLTIPRPRRLSSQEGFELPRQPSSERATTKSDGSLSVSELKASLISHGVDVSGCVEKADLQSLWTRFIRCGPSRSPPVGRAVSSPEGTAQQDRARDAETEVYRILSLHKGAFFCSASWAFAVLACSKRDGPSVQSSYRALMRRLHPDRVEQSERVTSALEIIREAREVSMRSLSRIHPPDMPRGLRSSLLSETPGNRKFQLSWAKPPEADSERPVRKYTISAVDPSYGRPLTVAVLEPDYSQEHHRFVSIHELTSHTLAERDLQKMSGFWLQRQAIVQVSACNEAGQSPWAVLHVNLVERRASSVVCKSRC
eukprot:TRINITY_DN38114_c0_g1_i1.p1 TRINITY_DN38114_c0_g1~~TRINITY_DN38114_c0_g1_i1.p1  ORF type:complete len:960 (+),score=136.36 TRINITY_DN38114_c0_g1_i1:62-2881(+)